MFCAATHNGYLSRYIGMYKPICTLKKHTYWHLMCTVGLNCSRFPPLYADIGTLYADISALKCRFVCFLTQMFAIGISFVATQCENKSAFDY